MYKIFAALVLFCVGMGVSMGFQNCGGGDFQSKSSGNDGIQVEVVTDESTDDDSSTVTDPGNGQGDNSGDGTGDGGGDGSNPDNPDDGSGTPPPGTGSNKFTFSFSSAHPENNIFFMAGVNNSPELATSRLLIKSYYFMAESHVYEQSGVTFQRDLPTAYCSNSALPHCAHTTADPCLGLGCYKSSRPVRCSWQKRLNKSEEGTFITAIQELRLYNRVVTDEDPVMMDCNDPILQFHSDVSLFPEQNISSLNISLANRSCVPNGSYYAVDETGTNIKNLFNNEINRMKRNINNQGDPEYCSRYSAYAWDTTKFHYKSQSGFTTAENAYMFDVTYEGQKVDMRFRTKGSSNILCANGVPVQNIEVSTLFPEAGLLYQVYRTSTTIADVPTAEITYDDPVDGGGVWRFFFDQSSALANSGGAILHQNQATPIKELIEQVLVNRAKLEGASWEAKPCN